MRTWIVRQITVMIAIALAFTAVLSLTESAEAGTPMGVRSSTGFISIDDFYVHNEYNVDDLWVVVWLENRDTHYRQYSDSDYYFYYRDIANSFAIPVDGSPHSSGEEKRALVELFTSTDCVFCPGAVGALDTLAEERFPDEFSLIEWHKAINPGSDPYETPASRGRFSSYNISSRPTTIFDGATAAVGGDQDPNNVQILKSYGNTIDLVNSFLLPQVSFSGSADTGGDYLSYNISFEVTNPMVKGDWVVRAAVCEDIDSDHGGARMRFVPRGSLNSKALSDLQEGHPDITVEEEATFQGLDPEEIKGNFTMKWNASDPQDGDDVTIDIRYWGPDDQWKELATGLENTGSFTWNTGDPRVPDGQYEVAISAEDSQSNSILASDLLVFIIDNPDFPHANFSYPAQFETFNGEEEIRWTSSDDEDDSMDMLARVSISNDTGQTWKVISFNRVTGEDWIANLGSFTLNTLNYEDIPTYKLKVDIKDTDNMITTIESAVFEIYNNDAPRAFLYSPKLGETISSVLDIGWKVTDQEDLPSAIEGNFSIRKSGQERWTVLYEGLLDDEMENRTFDTADLMGDGDYELKFSVEDSRGKTHSVNRQFSIYDPDPPVFSSISSPRKDLTDIREETITVSWECSDADEGETLSYDVHISQADLENWTLLAEGLDTETYVVDLSLLEEGSYRIRVTAVDSSAGSLTSETFFGPFYYNAPDSPDISQFLPSENLDGGIPSDINSTMEAGEFFLDLSWTASDDDNDNITFVLHYRKTGDQDWTLIEDNLEGSSYSWNMTALPSGEYRIRLTAVDESPETLTSQMILGPFSWNNVILNPPADDDTDDDDEPVPEDEDDSDEPDWGLYIIIGAASVVVVIIVVILALFMASKLGKRKGKTDVIPDQKDMDFTQIPDFERNRPPVQQPPPRQVMAGTYQEQQAPVQEEPQPTYQEPQPQGIEGNVNWEGEDQSGTENESVPEQTQESSLPEEDTGDQEGSEESTNIAAPPEPPV